MLAPLHVTHRLRNVCHHLLTDITTKWKHDSYGPNSDADKNCDTSVASTPVPQYYLLRCGCYCSVTVAAIPNYSLRSLIELYP